MLCRLTVIPEVCDLVFQQHAQSFFDLLEMFLLFYWDSTDSIRPEATHTQEQKWMPLLLSLGLQGSQKRTLGRMKGSRTGHTREYCTSTINNFPFMAAVLFIKYVLVRDSDKLLNSLINHTDYYRNNK